MDYQIMVKCWKTHQSFTLAGETCAFFEKTIHHWTFIMCIVAYCTNTLKPKTIKLEFTFFVQTRTVCSQVCLLSSSSWNFPSLEHSFLMLDHSILSSSLINIFPLNLNCSNQFWASDIHISNHKLSFRAENGGFDWEYASMFQLTVVFSISNWSMRFWRLFFFLMRLLISISFLFICVRQSSKSFFISRIWNTNQNIFILRDIEKK